MPRKALEDLSFEIIKQHIIDPENAEGELTYEQRFMMDRWISAAKMLEKYPVTKHAVNLLMAEYPSISQRQAYEDVRNASRLFNSMQKFDYDLWHSWLIKDIAELIEKAKGRPEKKDENGDVIETEIQPNFKAWNAAHANLIKAIGEPPEDPIDPSIREKSVYYLVINRGGESKKIELDKVRNQKPGKFSDFLRLLSSDIDEHGAEEIINT